MNDDGRTFKLPCHFLGRETDLAVQISTLEGEMLWIPLSQVVEMIGRKDGERSTGHITMTEWIAQKKGLC